MEGMETEASKVMLSLHWHGVARHPPRRQRERTAGRRGVNKGEGSLPSPSLN